MTYGIASNKLDDYSKSLLILKHFAVDKTYLLSGSHSANNFSS